MRLAKNALAVLFCAVCVGVISAALYFSRQRDWAKSVITNIDQLQQQIATSPTEIRSADGRVLYRAQSEYRRPVTYEQIPPIVRMATIAAEDRRFYEHRGVDGISIARALVSNVREGRQGQGASTITMQLAKRLYTSSERTFERKVKDMALAVELEQTLTKNELLTLYLNQVYYGAGAYGIKAAADVYFGKDLASLTVGEAALLARLVQRPSEDNPFQNPDRAMRNRDLVLASMFDLGNIDRSTYDLALQEPLKLRSRNFGSGERILGSPYFTRYVLDYLRRELPDIDLSQGGYKIETTLDTRLDRIAKETVQRVVRENRRRRVTTGAFVLLDTDGRVLAMAGGVDYERNQYNVVTQGRRQPGSAFKPFVYATALSLGVLDPYGTISNEQLVIEDARRGRLLWPKNGNGRYGGVMSVGSALAASVNVPAARVAEMVGPAKVVAMSRDVFGISTPMDPVLSIALGSEEVSPLELAEAYSVFANRGDRAEAFPVRRVVGPDGKVVREWAPSLARNVLSLSVSDAMDGFLRLVVTSGTGRRALEVPNARGKTGTTSDNRDAWFCGYTNSLIGVGWVGNEQKRGNRWVYEEMPSVYGGQVTIQIWSGVMKEATRIYAQEERARDREIGSFGTPEDAPEPDAADDVTGTLEEAFPETVPPLEPAPPGTGEGREPAPTTTLEAGDPNPTAETPKTPAARPAAQPSTPRAKTPPPEPDVEVVVCADSGARANPYCPETITRRFPRGRAPKTTCPVHGP